MGADDLTPFRVRTLKSFAALMLIAASLAATPANGALLQSTDATTQQKRVLVLYSVSRESEIATIGNHDFPRILRTSISEGIDYYTEYFEIDRFRDPNYQNDFFDLLLRKYQNQRLDVIIAVSTPIVDFIQKYRSKLFPDTPVVFFEAADVSSRHIPNATGVVGEVDLAATVKLALQLQPSLERVFVVVGTEKDNDVLYKLSLSQLAHFQPRLEITYLSDLTRDALESRLSSLPQHSMVLYLGYDRDVAGENYHPLLFLDSLIAAANSPTYCWVESAMGHGILGGTLKSQTLEIAALANMAVRVLHGEPANGIPVAFPDLNTTQVDWRQLRRWDIDAARVPSNAVVLFKEPSEWERYRGVILGAVGVVLGQSALIGLLLFHRLRRHQAEAAVVNSEGRLRQSYDHIRDLGARLLMAQDAERSHIARELHDDVSQELAMLTIDLELIAGTGCDVPGDNETLLNETLARARAISSSVRDLSHRLHPETLQGLGLLAALGRLCRESSRRDLTVTFIARDVPNDLSQTVTLCLYRIAQEALLNVLRHSGASQVSIQLIGVDDEVVLHVEDNGRGFEPDVVGRKGLGLISMSERAEAVGGKLKIISGSGQGTRVQVSVPVGRQRSSHKPADAPHPSDIAATVP